MGAIYEVYIDVLAVNNFLADLAALLAVHLFRRRRVRAYRILSGALLASAASCVLFLVCQSPAAYLLTVHFLLNPAVLFYCFRQKSKHDFFSDLCIAYFAFLILGGAVEWLQTGVGGFFSYQMAIGIALVGLPASSLWLRRQFQSRTRYVEAELCQNGRRINVKALCDSGNLLTDPYEGKPVSMIDRKLYEEAFGAAQSVRLIPYESLGCRCGLLEAVTIEELNIASANGTKSSKRAVLGLADHALFQNKPYSMIINPQENNRRQI